MLLAIGLLVLCPAAEVVDARQDTAAQEREPSELDRLLKAAKTGSPVVRPQAARRIVRLWSRSEEAQRGPIVERLVAETGDDNDSLAKMGDALVEILGEFDDPALRAKLWAAVDDPDFPWRPNALRSLAVRIGEDELPRFVTLLDDPIAQVRAAAITGIQNLGAREAKPALRTRLADENDVVRRSAADTLYRWGDKKALWYLFEELRRDDAFFDRPTGREARYQTYGLISRHIEDMANYDAGKPPEENKVVLAVLETKVKELAGPRPELPATAQAITTKLGERMGVEVRSCRRGEFYLRWTPDDRLLVGLGSPAVLQLPEGTFAALQAKGAKRSAEVSERMVGKPGCDLEMFHWRPVDFTTMWIVSKGPDSVDDLRPDPLGVLYVDLLATLPDEGHADPRLNRLRSRVHAALLSVGGDLE